MTEIWIDAEIEERMHMEEWLRSHIVHGHLRNPIEVRGLNLDQLKRLHRKCHEVKR